MLINSCVALDVVHAYNTVMAIAFVRLRVLEALGARALGLDRGASVTGETIGDGMPGCPIWMEVDASKTDVFLMAQRVWFK